MSDVYPSNPSIGESANGRIWTGTQWSCPVLITDAPADGNFYGRMNNTWQQVVGSHGGEVDSLLVDSNLSVIGTTELGGYVQTGDSMGVAGELQVGGQLLCNDMLAIQGAQAGGQQPRVMLIGSDPTGISFGFWQDGTLMAFGDGDASGTPNDGLMQLSQVGDLYLVGTLSQGCDERLKTNIADCVYGLTEIKQLNCKSYKRRHGSEEIGVIAQQVKELIPEAVHSTKRFLAVEPMALIAVLINAIKDLAVKVERLEAHHATK